MIQKNILNMYKDKYYLNAVAVIGKFYFFLGREKMNTIISY